MHFKLANEIIKRSVADNWDQAKLEWSFSHAYQSEDFEICLCGHYPIKNICVISNKKNKSLTEVGNCCVTKFMGIQEGDKIFQSINRIKNDVDKSISADVIEYLFNRKVIDDFEYKFYMDILRKRNLSDKQRNIKRRINKKLVAFTSSEVNSAIAKINLVIEWAKDNPSFDTSFVRSLEKSCRETGKLSDKQEQSLEKIIAKFKIKNT